MSFSINTNNSAMAALQSLSQTTTALNRTQNEVSTGKSVNSASDNPAVYAIAQGMNSQVAALSGVQSGLQTANNTLSAANTGLGTIGSLMSSLASTVSTAQTSGYNANTMNGSINQALSQIDSAAKGSNVNGVNLLAGAVGNGVNFTTVTTAQDTTGSMFVQHGVNATSSGLGLDGLTALAGQTVSTSGAYTDSGASATTLSITTGGGKAANPTINYNFVMDSNTAGTSGSAGMQSSSTIATTLNNAVGTGFGITVGSDGILSASAGAITATTTDTSGNTTYTLSNGDNIVASLDASGNTSYTANTAFDSNGNATSQTVVVDVNTGTADKANGATAIKQGQTNALTSAMNNAGFGTSLGNDGTLSFAGDNITGSTAGATFGTATASTTTSSTSMGMLALSGAQHKLDNMTAAVGGGVNTVTQLSSTVSSVSNSLTSSVGALTDADLAAESAKLTSLQTKQQLAIQSLSIANSQSQTLLSLFHG